MISISQACHSEEDIIFLCILNNTSFSEASLANIFFPSLCLVFSFSFHRTEFLILMKPCLSMLPLINCAFGIIAGSHFHVCGFDRVTERSLSQFSGK